MTSTCFSAVSRPTKTMRFFSRGPMTGVYWVRSMPQLTGITPSTSIVRSRKSAARRVGVVTARVSANVRAASAQANFSTMSSMNLGIVVWSRMFSAITWFVAITGMPR